MAKPWFPLCLLLLAAPVAHADGAPEQAAVARVPAPARLKQQLRAHGAEVVRLQQQVGKQEARSLQASQQLQEQDRRIAELQRQLEETARSQSTGAANH